MQVVLCNVGESPRIELVDPEDLRKMQSFVDGFIEIVNIAPDLCLICNEEGAINGMPFNKTILLESGPGEWKSMDIYGNFFICGHDGPDLVSLGIEEAKYLMAICKNDAVTISRRTVQHLQEV